ncbi:hypothetical protein ACFY1P_20790 [Streptomyces sp. NPDC001407]|uniref:hypothetical protein n=1 Tax=Streptomyces sp. NPDC001407 TaxID=3364573 RepID=UPI0036B9DAAC
MSHSLARCVEAVARLLDACGPMEPVRLGLSAQDAQAEVRGSGPAARASLDRLAAVSGTGTVASPLGGTLAYSVTADLDDGLVLVAGLAEPVDGSEVTGRTTSTAAASTLLRALTPWVHGLDVDVLQAAELWVDDQGHAFTVRLLTTAGQGTDLEAVFAAAGKGLDRLRTRRTDSGLDGAGHLPCGRMVQIGVVRLY